MRKKTEESESRAAKGTDQNKVTPFWEYDVALIDSRSDLINLLIGVLSFLNGRWVLRDQNHSVECIAVGDDYEQYQDRLIFTSKFAIHRETFTVLESKSTKLYQKIYISIEEYQVASSALLQSYTNIGGKKPTDCVSFFVLYKSCSQVFYSGTSGFEPVFGFLIVASLQKMKEEDIPAKRTKFDHHLDTVDFVGDTDIALLLDHNHQTLKYPDVQEGDVYEISMTREELLKNRLLNCFHFALRSILHKSFSYCSARINVLGFKEVPHFGLNSPVCFVANHVPIREFASNFYETNSRPIELPRKNGLR